MKQVIFWLLFPFYTISQITYSGKVINRKTKEAIPFATVGLIKENTGTTSNEDVSFSLQSKNTKTNDTLLISCVGYATLQMPVSTQQPANISIELTEQATLLKEVVVTSKRQRQTTTLNDFSKCGSYFVGSNGYQTQLAQHFEVPVENSLLSAIKICRMGFGLLDPEKTIFRIRIYDIDSATKGPAVDLCNQVIEVKTRSRVVNLDLEKYNIRVPHKDFFVAIEWLKIPYNEIRTKANLNGVETEFVSYRPSIGWTDDANPTMQAWMLNYRNKWQLMTTRNNKTSVSIAATVKYE